MFHKGNARWVQPVSLSKHLLGCICPQEPGGQTTFSVFQCPECRYEYLSV